MPRKTLREQIKELSIFIVSKHPDWISYRFIMLYMNCGSTKAQELCKTLAESDGEFEYQNGDIRFLGDPKKWIYDPFVGNY